MTFYFCWKTRMKLLVQTLQVTSRYHSAPALKTSPVRSYTTPSITFDAKPDNQFCNIRQCSPRRRSCP